jgi:hypothetical protein
MNEHLEPGLHLDAFLSVDQSSQRVCNYQLPVANEALIAYKW